MVFLHQQFGPMRRIPSRQLMLNGVHSLQPEHQDRVLEYLRIHRALVEAYPERLFLATCFFPHLSGVVLNVGVMEMNKDDHLLLKEPHLMRSLDTDASCAVWGSPFGHATCDFFDWCHESSLGGVALFGAIGDRNDRSPDAAHIGVEQADRVAQHSALLLEPGGQLLLGIELNHFSRRARYLNIRVWRRWLRRSRTLHDLFDGLQVFQGRNNIIVIADRSTAPTQVSAISDRGL